MFCEKCAFYATSGVLRPSAPERRSSISVVGCATQIGAIFILIGLNSKNMHIPRLGGAGI